MAVAKGGGGLKRKLGSVAREHALDSTLVVRNNLKQEHLLEFAARKKKEK